MSEVSKLSAHGRVRPFTAAAAAVALVAATVVGRPVAAAPSAPIGSVTIAPTAAEVASVADYVVTYAVAPDSSFKGTAGTEVPAGWSPPQTTDPTGAGFVSVDPGTCRRAVLTGVHDTGPWTIVIDADCKRGSSFSLSYLRAAAPTTAGVQTFRSGSLTKKEFSTASPHPAVDVVAGPAATLDVSGFPDPTTAGQEQAVHVVGVDSYGNRPAPIADPVTLSSDDGAASLPPAADATTGSVTLPVTLRTAGIRSITATAGALTGSQTGISVEAGPLARIEIAPAHATIAAGESQTYTAHGFDAFDNPRGPVPATYTIAPDGSCTVATCTATTAGTHTVTGTSDGFSDEATLEVETAQPAALQFGAVPATVDAGRTFPLLVRAVDQHGNVATGYSGPVTFSSSDPNAVLPGTTSLTDGATTVEVSLWSDGSHTVTVSDAFGGPPSAATTSPIEVLPTADLSIAVTDTPDPAHDYETVAYTLTVTNDGPQPANNTTATLVIPAGWTFVSTSSADGCSLGPVGTTVTIECTLGTIAAGTSATRTLHASYQTLGDKTVTAETTSSTTDPDPTDNSTTQTTTVNAA